MKEGKRKSMFGENGIVAGKSRKERWLLWPMGVEDTGAMRQWGIIQPLLLDDGILMMLIYLNVTSSFVEAEGNCHRQNSVRLLINGDRRQLSLVEFGQC